MVLKLENLTKNDLINFQKTSTHHQNLIIKFEAEWCGPCKKIKNLCELNANKLNDLSIYVVIDIDESIELYHELKTKRMVNGIPTLLLYKGGARDENVWYIPNDSVIGGEQKKVNEFFSRIK